MSLVSLEVHGQSNRSHSSSLGVTLVEAVLSLAILGIIMVSIGAASSLLMRLMPRNDDPRTVAIGIGSAYDLLDADVHAATAVQMATPSEFRLTVGGIGEGGAPASVVYRYDSDQQSVLRGVGAQPQRPIATGVTSATFGYSLIQRAQGIAVEPVIADSAFGTESIACMDTTLTLESGAALRQRIAPVLDDDAMLWRIESISMRLKQHVIFGGGSCRVAFYYMKDDGTMGETPFAVSNINVSSLTLFSFPAEWRTIEFNGLPWLDRSESIAVVLSSHGGGAFRTHGASRAGYPPLEVYNSSDGTAIAIPGFVLCFRLSGQSMVPGENPPAVELLRDMTLLINHPTLSVPLLHNAIPPVPIVVQP